MLDVGFSELIVVALVALLVLGPDKLRTSARTGALWLGRLRRAYTQIKTDIEREIDTDEINRQLHNEAIMANLKKNPPANSISTPEKITPTQDNEKHE